MFTVLIAIAMNTTLVSPAQDAARQPSTTSQPEDKLAVGVEVVFASSDGQIHAGERLARTPFRRRMSLITSRATAS